MTKMLVFFSVSCLLFSHGSISQDFLNVKIKLKINFKYLTNIIFYKFIALADNQIKWHCEKIFN